MDATAVKLEIQLSDTTLGKLKQDGHRLYILLPVMSSNQSAVPLIWSRTERYLQQTTITVPCANYGFISENGIEKNGTIVIGNKIGVSPGTSLTLEKSGMLSSVSSRNPGIYFSSQSAMAYSCGLAKEDSGRVPIPYCAAPLNAGLSVPFTPLSGIFAFFMTPHYKPGNYLETSLGQGIFYQKIEPGATVHASFDIAKGWFPMDENADARIIATETRLAGVLVIPPRENMLSGLPGGRLDRIG